MPDSSIPTKAPLALSEHANIESVAFSPNSRWLVTGSDDHTASLWDLNASGSSPKPIVLQGHDGAVQALAFSADGRWLATGCGSRLVEREGGVVSIYEGDRTARLWDLEARDPSKSAVVLRGHEADLTALAISPDSRWLVSGSKQDARLWDLSAADPSGSSIVLQAGEVGAVAIGAGSDSAFIWSRDGVLRRFALRKDVLLLRAQEFAGRNLSNREWTQYFPGKQYHKTFAALPIHPTVTEALTRAARTSGFENALEQISPPLHSEARSAAIGYLIDDARRIASEAEDDRALIRLKEAESLQGGLDPRTTLEIKRIATRAYITLAGKTLEYSSARLSAEDQEFLRRAFEFNPGLRSQREFVLLAWRALFSGPAEPRQFGEALKSYLDLEARFPDSGIAAKDWNGLCWFGSLHDAAAEVKVACDRAVAIGGADPRYRDSRALARALTGDREGAIADWQYWVQHEKSSKALAQKQRREWLATLSSGKNFFLTAALRASLLEQ